MSVMYRLHVDLYAGLAGKLFLGFMGLLLMVAIISGVVLYAPFMRKLRFGEVRQNALPAPAGWTCTTCSASSPWSGRWRWASPG